LNNPPNPKERNLLKGAIRRIFSRSDLRKQVIDASEVPGYTDPNRPRAKRWCQCAECKQMVPKSYMECDHIEPLIPLNRSLEDMTWTEVVDRAWCDISNLRAVCETCHDVKTKAETKERKRIRDEKNPKKKLDKKKRIKV
jgi:5-methylcytosine-specific restriction endonuclease McrA